MFDYDADLLVLGAGPAGLTAAQYGARASLKTLVLEQMAPGGQALNIDVLENYPGNVGHGDTPPRSGFDFCEDLHKQAKAFGARFIMEGAVSVARAAEEGSSAAEEGSSAPYFTAVLQGGKVLRVPAVILATGAEHRRLAVPGEAEFSGRGVSYCATCDGPFFKGRRILVVGGGDAACDEAQYLSRLTDTVILIHRKSMFRAQKALAERTLANPHITVSFNTRLLEIRGETRVMSVVLEGPGGSREEPMDAVFIFAGSIPQTAPVKGLGLHFDETGSVITNQNMETAVPGFFAAGDVRSGPFRQVVVAAGEGAVAAHGAAAYIDSLRGVGYH
ncbi:MAG: FAD-dependent oxidoreductase [Spirochaetaceae bacterium]|jgi:thioredoxin reductase (NADPH)|nr:FAD-dependent oxidoreductase [Spirochaetaceae bacterium]